MLAVIQSLNGAKASRVKSQVIAGTVDLSSECQPITLAVVTQNSRFDGNEPSQMKALEGLVLGRDLPAHRESRNLGCHLRHSPSGRRSPGAVVTRSNGHCGLHFAKRASAVVFYTKPTSRGRRGTFVSTRFASISLSRRRIYSADFVAGLIDCRDRHGNGCGANQDAPGVDGITIEQIVVSDHSSALSSARS
jgi:hypothetical protein